MFYFRTFAKDYVLDWLCPVAEVVTMVTLSGNYLTNGLGLLEPDDFFYCRPEVNFIVTHIKMLKFEDIKPAKWLITHGSRLAVIYDDFRWSTYAKCIKIKLKSSLESHY